MNKKLLLISLCITVFLISACEQQAATNDVAFVPIDQIQVEEDQQTEYISTEQDAGQMDSEKEEGMKEDSMEGHMMDDAGMEKEDAMQDSGTEIIVEDGIIIEDTPLEGGQEDITNDGIVIEDTQIAQAVESGDTETIDLTTIPVEEDAAEDDHDHSADHVHDEEDHMDDTTIAVVEETEPAPREIVLIVQETDLVNVQPVANDPDQDKLEFTYSSPLNSQGKWQTTYGDQGEYTITITASDSELTTSRDALLIVNKKEELPVISILAPVGEMAQEINENSDLQFTIKASDLNKDPLTYMWKLDGEVVSVDENYKYEADYNSAGSHTIKVDVSDGTSTVSELWAITVNNVDRPPVLKVIPDVTVKETETVVITPAATDPDGDEITYTISDPVGDSGIWETTYDSAGVYTVTVAASDGELDDSQQVKVTVINVNRAPIIEDIIQVQ